MHPLTLASIWLRQCERIDRSIEFRLQSRPMKRFLIPFLFVFFILPLSACRHNTDPLAKARKQMLEQQLKWRRITDAQVLKAMEKVAREKFIPESLALRAYDDLALPIGEEQTISEPYVVAFMTQAAALKPDDKVLEIGTGSGYQAAVLAEIVSEVFTIEILPNLAAAAEKRLGPLGYSDIHVRAGDGYLGWPEAAPFDAILLTASPDTVPLPLQAQLKEGGRLVVPLGGSERFQTLVLYTKKNGTFKKVRELLPVSFVPMSGKIREKK